MYNVAIVDDELQTALGIGSHTDWEAYNMHVAAVASNGQDVLDLMADQTIDLLITDVNMPIIDGISLIKAARELQPSLRCIVISAYSEFTYVKKALMLNVENYLLKPINENELHETLLQTLQNLDRDRSHAQHEWPDMVAFRTNILDRWVNGLIQEFELFERGELLHIDLRAEAYRAAVLEVNVDGTEQGAAACGMIPAAARLLELCRSMPASPCLKECFMDTSFRVVIISHDSLEGELESMLRSIIQKAASSGIHAFAAAGRLTASSSRVHESFSDARLALHYRYLNPAVPIWRCGAEMDPFALSRVSFIQLLQAGSVDQALQAILHSLRASADPHTSAIPFMLQLVQSTIDAGRVGSALPASMLRQLSTFMEARKPEQLTHWMKSAIAEAVKAMHERSGSYHPLIRQTLEQIRLRLGKELSLKTLAASMKVSSAYLGQLFKDETGKYFNDYVAQARLEAARALLLETDLKISDIAPRIGIPNHSYFNRLFKKTYGYSPVEFRRRSLVSMPAER
ncbi:response regulator [Paenibacillus sp. R14(2021)]|uniref:response regulator n=1 Tax=Paenibacillus sp. R14(2021) TaxID=2859228 RepID=UPI001C615E32|nr:response regulator [Paenibacillus sp. R14(2021)]